MTCRGLKTSGSQSHGSWARLATEAWLDVSGHIECSCAPERLSSARFSLNGMTKMAQDLSNSPGGRDQKWGLLFLLRIIFAHLRAYKSGVPEKILGLAFPLFFGL
jgi:hypothetical protein